MPRRARAVGCGKAVSPGPIVPFRRSLGHDVLERRPADEREHEVVEAQKGEIPAGRVDDRGADPADHDRDREREKEQTGGAGPARGWRRPWRRGKCRPRRCRGRRARSQRASLRRARGRRARIPAAQRARRARGNVSVARLFATQMALRSDGASTSASRTRCSRSGTKARPRPSSAVKMIATHKRPPAARSDEPAGSEKWKTTKTATTKRSIAGRVSRARSSSRKVLARKCAYVGEVAHASASRLDANGSIRAGSCVETRNVRSPAQLGELGVPRVAAPCVSSAVYGSSSTSSAGSCRRTRQSASRLRHAARVRGDAVAACVQEGRQRSRSMPIRLAALGHAVEAASRAQRFSRAVQLAVDEAARGRGSRSDPARQPTRSSPSVGTARPAQMRRTSSFPSRWGLSPRRNPPSGSDELDVSTARAWAPLAPAELSGPRSRGQSRSRRRLTQVLRPPNWMSARPRLLRQGKRTTPGGSPTMLRPRIAVPIVLVAACRRRRGRRGSHAAQPDDAGRRRSNFSAGSVSRRPFGGRCVSSDGTYQLTTATYTGTATLERRPPERGARDPCPRAS